MHDAAYEWVAAHAPRSVLDIGGADVNGTVRDLFPGARYAVVDRQPLPNVDHVINVCEWVTDQRFDVVVCCEVLEHAREWRVILDAAWQLTVPGGRLIVTAAGPGRPEHLGVDGEALRDGEWYGNIDPADLAEALARWRDVTVDVSGVDVRAVATR